MYLKARPRRIPLKDMPVPGSAGPRSQRFPVGPPDRIRGWGRRPDESRADAGGQLRGRRTAETGLAPPPGNVPVRRPLTVAPTWGWGAFNPALRHVQTPATRRAVWRGRACTTRFPVVPIAAAPLAPRRSSLAPALNPVGLADPATPVAFGRTPGPPRPRRGGSQPFFAAIRVEVHRPEGRRGAAEAEPAARASSWPFTSKPSRRPWDVVRRRRHQGEANILAVAPDVVPAAGLQAGRPPWPVPVGFESGGTSVMGTSFPRSPAAAPGSLGTTGGRRRQLPRRPASPAFSPRPAAAAAVGGTRRRGPAAANRRTRARPRPQGQAQAQEPGPDPEQRQHLHQQLEPAGAAAGPRPRPSCSSSSRSRKQKQQTAARNNNNCCCKRRDGAGAGGGPDRPCSACRPWRS